MSNPQCPCCGLLDPYCTCTEDGAKLNGSECSKCQPLSRWFTRMTTPVGLNIMTPEQKKDDEELFGSESRYTALLRIAQELQLCADNMGLKPGTEDPEIVARARSASVQLNQLISNQ